MGAQSDISYIHLQTTFTNEGSRSFSNAPSRGPASSAGGYSAAIPTLYGYASLSDDFKIGLSLNAPFGPDTEYGSDWIGRYHAVKSELTMSNLQPTVAYRVNDALSLGLGLNIQKASAELTNAVDHGLNLAALGVPGASAGSHDGLSKLSGKDTAFGATAGVMINLDEDSRIGVSYRSRIHHTFKGKVEQSGVPSQYAAIPSLTRIYANSDASAKITTPDVAALGVYHRIDPQWAVMGDVSWTNWSLFKELRVRRADVLPDSVTKENWRDSWFFALGTTYTPHPGLDLSVGVAYDVSPVSDAYRTARVPDSDRTWLSLGASYALNDAITLNASYAHIFADNPKIDTSISTSTLLGQRTDHLTGRYDNEIDLFSVGISGRF